MIFFVIDLGLVHTKAVDVNNLSFNHKLKGPSLYLVGQSTVSGVSFVYINLWLNHLLFFHGKYNLNIL